MVEMSVWLPIFLIEGWLLSSGTLAFLLWRVRRRRQALQAEVETLRRGQITQTPTAESLSAEQAAEPGDREETQQVEHETMMRLADRLESGDDVEATMQQLRESTATLQHLLDTVQEQLRQATNDEEKIQVLERMLRDTKGSVAVLRRTDACMHQSFQDKNRQFRRCVDELRWSIRQRALLEASVKKLQTANAQLTRELKVKNALLADFASKGADRAKGEPRGEVRHQEFDEVKNQLIQRVADLSRLQEQYDDLSEEYQLLFQTTRSSAIPGLS